MEVSERDRRNFVGGFDLWIASFLKVSNTSQQFSLFISFFFYPTYVSLGPF
jgi:hypothetical protein